MTHLQNWYYYRLHLMKNSSAFFKKLKTKTAPFIISLQYFKTTSTKWKISLLKMEM